MRVKFMKEWTRWKNLPIYCVHTMLVTTKLVKQFSPRAVSLYIVFHLPPHCFLLSLYDFSTDKVVFSQSVDVISFVILAMQLIQKTMDLKLIFLSSFSLKRFFPLIPSFPIHVTSIITTPRPNRIIKRFLWDQRSKFFAQDWLFDISLANLVPKI